jgi:hypothetical protein
MEIPPRKLLDQVCDAIRLLISPLISQSNDCCGINTGKFTYIPAKRHYQRKHKQWTVLQLAKPKSVVAGYQ